MSSTPPSTGSGLMARSTSNGMSSPGIRSIDLAPPPRLKDHRSGSSSSLASGASGSQYMSEARSMSVGRPSIDESRAGTSLGRSPLADTSMPVPPASAGMGRRPSGEAMMAGRRPSEDVSRRPPGSAGQQGPGLQGAAGLGYGMPTSQSHPSRLSGLSIDRPSSSDQRRPSGASSSAMAKQASSDGGPSRTSMDATRPNALPDQTTPTRPSRANRDSNHAIPPIKQPSYTEVFEEEENPKTPRPPDITTSAPLGAPKITTTLPSPAVGRDRDPSLASPVDGGPTKHRPQRRASFHPPPLDTAFSREVLLTSRTGALPGVAGLTVDDDGQEGKDAIMDSVEDMLESFDWTLTTGTMDGARKKGSADAIEIRLLDELSALDSVSSPNSLVHEMVSYGTQLTVSPRPTSMRSWSRMTESPKFWVISMKPSSSLTTSTSKSPVTRCS